MTSARIGIFVVAAAVLSASAAFAPAHAEFFGCNTPKVRYYNGTPWSYHPTARQSYAAASYRASRSVYHVTRRSYRTQW